MNSALVYPPTGMLFKLTLTVATAPALMLVGIMIVETDGSLVGRGVDVGVTVGKVNVGVAGKGVGVKVGTGVGVVVGALPVVWIAGVKVLL